MPGKEPLSLIVCTRNRPGDLARSLPTFVANLDDLAALIIVDQSDDDETEQIVAACTARHPSVRYARCAERGLSRARNQGAALATSELVGFTDDDCLLPPGWAAAVTERLAAPHAGAFFGAVRAAPFDWRLGHTPEFPEAPSLTLRKPNPSALPPIMGANMAFKREALVRIGGFDPVLGAGADLRSGEDVDAAYRVLRQGYELVVSPTPAIVHFGFRSFADGGSNGMIRSGHRGLGAYYAKHMRAADWRMALTCAGSLKSSFAFALGNLRTGQRPLGLGRVAYTLLGMAQSCRYPLNRNLRVLIPRAN